MYIFSELLLVTQAIPRGAFDLSSEVWFFFNRGLRLKTGGKQVEKLRLWQKCIRGCAHSSRMPTLRMAVSK